MKKYLLAVLAAAVLAVPAWADVVNPGEVVGGLLWDGLPYLLIIAVVLVTAVLLRRRKK